MNISDEILRVLMVADSIETFHFMLLTYTGTKYVHIVTINFCFRHSVKPCLYNMYVIKTLIMEEH